MIQQLCQNLSIVLKCERLGKDNNMFKNFGLEKKWYSAYCMLADIFQKLKDEDCISFNQSFLSSLNSAILHLLAIESGKIELERDNLENFIDKLCDYIFGFYGSIIVEPKGKITAYQK